MVMRVIDTHAIFGTNRPLGMFHTLDKFREIQDFIATEYPGRYDVRFMVVSASPDTNLVIAKVAEERPDIFAGAYLQVVSAKCLPWRYTPPDEIAKLAEKPEIKGLNIVPPLVRMSINDESLDRYVRIAAKRGIPFMMHFSTLERDGLTGLEQLDKFMKQYVRRYPDLKVIVEHFGGLVQGQEDQMLARVQAHPKNLYFNTVGFTGELKRLGKHREWRPRPEEGEYWFDVLQNALKDVTVRENILFGTDYPELSNRHPEFDKPHPNEPVPYLSLFDRLSEEHQEQLDQNVREVFDLKI